MIEWLSYKSAAERCEVSQRTIRAWVKSGQLRISIVGGIHRIRKSDLDSLFETGYENPELIKMEKEINSMIEGMNE